MSESPLSEGTVGGDRQLGVDVGGTFTKAVLVDHVSREVVGRFSVLTTHEHQRGVAAGVVHVFEQVLQQSGVRPEEIVFLAHSTTQATNALLEGDVAPVGIVGIAGAAAAKLAEERIDGCIRSVWVENLVQAPVTIHQCTQVIPLAIRHRIAHLDR